MPLCADGETEVSACIKYMLLLGTFIFWELAVDLLVVGALAYREQQEQYYKPIEDVSDVAFNIYLVLIILGSIQFLLNICGFVGALREIIFPLRVFYIGLTIVALLEVIGVSLLLAYQDEVLKFLGDSLKVVLVVNYMFELEKVIDSLQENLQCCGMYSYKDWNDNEYFNCSSTLNLPRKCFVPYTCCKSSDTITPGMVNRFCGADALSPSGSVDNVWTEGCWEKTIEWIQDNWLTIGVVAFSIIVPQLIGIFLGRQLTLQIQRQRRINRHTNPSRPT